MLAVIVRAAINMLMYFRQHFNFYNECMINSCPFCDVLVDLCTVCCALCTVYSVLFIVGPAVYYVPFTMGHVLYLVYSLL